MNHFSPLVSKNGRINQFLYRERRLFIAVHKNRRRNCGFNPIRQRHYLAKTDIESAFRQFPVHPDDWELLGIYWNKSYYFDKALPFGLRSAPYIFNQLSDALEWILLNKCSISYVGHILDDFLIMEPPAQTGLPSQACQTSLSSMLLTFRTLGIPIAEHKTEGPSLIIEFLGIIIDSQKMEVRLPSDKLDRLFGDLNSWDTKKSATLQEVQSLIGTLNFASKVIPRVELFCNVS